MSDFDFYEIQIINYKMNNIYNLENLHFNNNSLSVKKYRYTNAAYSDSHICQKNKSWISGFPRTKIKK